MLNARTLSHFFRFWLGSVSRCFHSRQSLLLENLALRQQLAILKRRHHRPKLGPLDKLFLTLACQFWSAWKQALMVVTPETVVGWHRAGFRLYWSLIQGGGSESKGGRCPRKCGT
jgi:putative transposase